MVRLRYTCRSFMSRRSCIGASDANKTRGPGDRLPGPFFVGPLVPSNDVSAISTILTR
jgi:hypothetical protein